MKEISTTSDSLRQFILYWGELGTGWGVNRTVAQIHALLILSPQPLTPADIADALGIARSNVSTSLRELLSWDLAEVVPTAGDRRTHYAVRKDIWAMFQTVLEQRKRREIDPTVDLLRTVLADLDSQNGEAHARRRLREMLDIFEAANRWYHQIRLLPPDMLKQLLTSAGDFPLSAIKEATK